MPEIKPVAKINVEKRRLEWALPTRWDTPTTIKLDPVLLYAEPDVQRMADEIERLRADAERYRFVRTADKVGISAEAARDPVLYDAAIDAAIAKGSERE